jgi:transcriptional regulator GlxA family with amidase domain
VRASLPIIARAAVRGQRVWASCSGTFVLAEAGLLDGRACTTSWWLAPLFRQRYPRAELTTDAMVVPAGAIVTAGAALAQVDLMLRLVRETAGASVAELCTRYLMLDERPSQGRYLVHDQLAHHDDAVRRAEDFARRALHRPIGVLDLAAAAGVSARTLERRVRAALGLSPVALLQRLRVEVAVHRLATTREPLADIATRVGYADPETLARLVRRHTGRSPREIRPQTGRPKP